MKPFHAVNSLLCRSGIRFIAAAVLWCVVFNLLADEANSAWDVPTADPYAIKQVVQRNIFLADRISLERAVRKAEQPPPPKTVEEPPPATEPVVPQDPDTRRVLVGVSVIDGTPTAFINNLETGKIDRVLVSEAYSRGTIESIGKAGVVYLAESGERREIQLRQTLAGEFSSSHSPSNSSNPVESGQRRASTPASASSTADRATGNDGSLEDLSPLERMRLRRLQENSSRSEPSP